MSSSVNRLLFFAQRFNYIDRNKYCSRQTKRAKARGYKVLYSILGCVREARATNLKSLDFVKILFKETFVSFL